MSDTDKIDDAKLLAPLHVFRFQIDFRAVSLKDGTDSDKPLCQGAFSDCTGLEATMEPKVIKEGGRNYGPAQRVGQVTFATVILKRGMTRTRDLWNWFALVSGGSYDKRLRAQITMFDTDGSPVLTWELQNALAIKFKTADLNAKGTSEIGIEELHLAHEGLFLKDKPTAGPL